MHTCINRDRECIKPLLLDLDVGFQSFGTGSREEILRRIPIRGPNFSLLSSKIENLGNTKSVKTKKTFVSLIFPFKGERETDRWVGSLANYLHKYIHMYIYIYMCVYTHTPI